MQGKKWIFLVSSFVLVFVTTVLPVAGYTIDRNRVYINDSNVYLAQEPHTLYSSGWVTNTLISKQYSGDIDVVFGFNSTTTRPTRAELYSPHEINETESYTCSPPYWYNYTLDPKYFYCWNNATVVDNGTGENITVSRLVFSHDFETVDLNTNTVYWTENRTEDYVNVADSFSKIDYDYNGKDTWYYARNVPVQAGNEYSLRIYVETQFNTAGKYDWCVKPSSESLQEAIANGRLYCLDPWWDLDGWTHGRAITITNNANTVLEAGYSINFSFNHAELVSAGKSLASGNDVRITWYNGTDEIDMDRINTTPFNNPSQNVTIWFALQEDISPSSSDMNYTLYYGNANAGAPPDNESNVFIAYDTFETGSLDTGKWTVGSGSPSISSGTLYLQTGGGTEGVRYNTKIIPPSQTRGYLWEADVKSQAIVGSYIFAGACSGAYCDAASDGVYMNWGHDNPQRRSTMTKSSSGTRINTDNSGFILGLWYRQKIIFFSNDVSFYQDGSFIKSHTTYIPSVELYAASLTARDDIGTYVDNVTVRKYVSPEPTVTLGEPLIMFKLSNPLVSPQSGTVGTTFTFMVNVTNFAAEDTTVTLYIYNSADSLVTSRQQLLINGVDLIDGKGQASITVQLNDTDVYKFSWSGENLNVNATTQNTTGPSVTSLFISGSESVSPVYGNPNQDYTFNITINSTAGVDITPRIWIVNENNDTVYSGTGTTIASVNGIASGISAFTVNITQTGDWRYFWNFSVNGVDVRYPKSGHLTGPGVEYYYVRSFNVPANLSKLTTTVMWSSINSSYTLSVRFIDPAGNPINLFDPGISTRTKVTETVIPLPLLSNYNITRYDGLDRMSITSPASGSWQLHVIDSEISRFETDIEFIR